MSLQVKEFFDGKTNTLTYVLTSPDAPDAVVIDPVLDYDMATGLLGIGALSPVIAFLRDSQRRLMLILETHAHADHISGALELKRQFPGARVAISARITQVQALMKSALNLPADIPQDGRQFEILLQPGQRLLEGALTFTALPTPGHTPACMSFAFQDCVFTGDALCMPDTGTGRCDFPGGSPRALYNSIRNVLFHFPDSTVVYVGHDYQPGGRSVQFKTTMAEQKARNIHLSAATQEAEFISFRETRDKTLSPPRLLKPSITANINGGGVLS